MAQSPACLKWIVIIEKDDGRFRRFILWMREQELFDIVFTNKNTMPWTLKYVDDHGCSTSEKCWPVCSLSFWLQHTGTSLPGRHLSGWWWRRRSRRLDTHWLLGMLYRLGQNMTSPNAAVMRTVDTWHSADIGHSKGPEEGRWIMLRKLWPHSGGTQEPLR